MNVFDGLLFNLIVQMKDFKGQSAPLDATPGLGSGDPNTNTEAPDIKWASEGLIQGTHIHITPHR